MQAGAVFSLFLPTSSISMGPSIIVDIFGLYDNSYVDNYHNFLRPEHDLDDQTKGSQS